MKKYTQRHKMPEKKVGVKTTCTKCRSEIICRMSNYSGYENKLQWQNDDGSAHYSNKSKNFECHIPKDGTEMFEAGTIAPEITSGNLGTPSRTTTKSTSRLSLSRK